MSPLPGQEERPKRDAEARRVASRMQLGRDGFSGVEIIMGVVGASEFCGRAVFHRIEAQSHQGNQ